MPVNFRPYCLALLIVLLCLAFPSGCVQSTRTTAQPPHGKLQPGDLPQTGQHFSPDELTSKDACPARLQEIEGALLLYDHYHHQLPPTLKDLLTVQPGLELTCPDSHLPYVYVPAGLRKPGSKGRIIVHDPVRNADGTWWCIIFEDSLPGKPMEMSVDQLTDPLFRGYQ